jgi:hypothetical protein
MWSLVAGLAICLAALGGILINIYVLLALLLAKQVYTVTKDYFVLVSHRKILLPRIEKSAVGTGTLPPGLGGRIYGGAL